MNKLDFRPFHEALRDFNLVSQKDADIRLTESILLSSRFLPENARMFPLELLSRFSRAPGANSAVIDRMVAEAATMVLVTSERCVVPFYPCVSASSAGVRRHTHYAPTYVLAVTTDKLRLRQKRQPRREENDEEEEEDEEEEDVEDDSDDLTTLAVVWGERCGLQVWRCCREDDTKFQPFYHICGEVWLRRNR